MNLTRFRAGFAALARRFWPPARKRAADAAAQAVYNDMFAAAFERQAAFPVKIVAEGSGADRWFLVSRAVALALLLSPSLALAQGAPVFQSGTMSAPHNLSKLTRNGQIQDIGGILGDSNGRGANPFAIKDALGLGVCSYTDVTTAAYYRICLGHDASGNGLLTVDAEGGATNKDFSVVKNGVTYPWGTGTGNVTGPSPTTDFAISLWNGTGGTTLRDGAMSAGQAAKLTSPGPADWTSHLVYDAARFIVNGLPITSEFGANTVPIATALMGGILVPSNAAGNAAGQAVAGYATTNSTTVGAVGLMGVGMIGVENGTGMWGINTITTNAPCPNPGIGCGAESGFNFGGGWGIELDFNIAKKSGGLTPTGFVDGVFLTGGSTVLPSGGANAFHIGPIGVAGPLAWSRGLYIDNGAATLGIDLGTLASAGASGAQPIVFRARDGGAGAHVAQIDTDSTGNLQLTPDFGAGSVITSGKMRVIYGDTAFGGSTITNSSVAAAAWGRLDIRTASFNGLLLAQLGTSGDVRIWGQDNAALSLGTNNAAVLTLSGTGATFAGALAVTGTFQVAQASPASGAACTAGQIVGDTGFLYTCSASGAWKRVAVTGGY